MESSKPFHVLFKTLPHVGYECGQTNRLPVVNFVSGFKYIYMCRTLDDVNTELDAVQTTI